MKILLSVLIAVMLMPMFANASAIVDSQRISVMKELIATIQITIQKLQMLISTKLGVSKFCGGIYGIYVDDNGFYNGIYRGCGGTGSPVVNTSSGGGSDSGINKHLEKVAEPL